VKTFLKILKTFFVSVAILIAAIIIFCIVYDAKESKEKKAQLITNTPELLIGPATTEIPTREPTATTIGSELSLTITAFANHPTATPNSGIARVPIYNGNGELIGYMGDNPTATPVPYYSPSNFRGNTNNSYNQNCTIKGNVSWRNNDEKIYHCPNWRDYNRTSIDYEDGDRWFCSEQEAIAAGFRKPDNVSDPCIP